MLALAYLNSVSGNGVSQIVASSHVRCPLTTTISEVFGQTEDKGFIVEPNQSLHIQQYTLKESLSDQGEWDLILKTPNE